MKKLSNILILISLGLLCGSFIKRTGVQLPGLIFQENSIAFDSIQNYDLISYKKMNTLERIKIIINAINKVDSDYNIRILGCSDSREKTKHIGLLRAEKVKKMLMQFNIKPSRIEIRDMRDSIATYSNKTIKGTKDLMDREKMRRYNRVVLFVFERRGYESK
jgi:hypothetical protein